MLLGSLFPDTQSECAFLINWIFTFDDNDANGILCTDILSIETYILNFQHHLSLWSTAILTPLVFYNDVKVQDFVLFSSNAVEEDSKNK